MNPSATRRRASSAAAPSWPAPTLAETIVTRPDGVVAALGGGTAPVSAGAGTVVPEWGMGFFLRTSRGAELYNM
jgi:hypothetical protein